MSHPLNLEYRQRRIDTDPFAGLIVRDTSFLNQLQGRHPCPKCGKSRKYFCYACYAPITVLQSQLPVVKLPIKVDIIKHPHEINGKSTSAHAAILAPDDVRVYTYPDIPTYNGTDQALIYPSYNSIDVATLFSSKPLLSSSPTILPKGHHKTTLLTSPRKLAPPEFCNTVLPIDRIVLIDSTWNQSKGIYKDERLRALRCVALQNRISQFWRHQKGSPRWYLSTIEAIHQFVIEVHLSMWGVHKDYSGLGSCFGNEQMLRYFTTSCDKGYKGQYDNLLFLFKHMYELIHKYYDHKTLFAYQRPLC